MRPYVANFMLLGLEKILDKCVWRRTVLVVYEVTKEKKI